MRGIWRQISKNCKAYYDGDLILNCVIRNVLAHCQWQLVMLSNTMRWFDFSTLYVPMVGPAMSCQKANVDIKNNLLNHSLLPTHFFFELFPYFSRHYLSFQLSGVFLLLNSFSWEDELLMMLSLGFSQMNVWKSNGMYENVNRWWFLERCIWSIWCIWYTWNYGWCFHWAPKLDAWKSEILKDVLNWFL